MLWQPVIVYVEEKDCLNKYVLRVRCLPKVSFQMFWPAITYFSLNIGPISRLLYFRIESTSNLMSSRFVMSLRFVIIGYKKAYAKVGHFYKYIVLNYLEFGTVLKFWRQTH
jgi:hypothetical protein